MKIITKKDIKKKDMRTEFVNYGSNLVYIEVWKNHDRYKCLLGNYLGESEDCIKEANRDWKKADKNDIDWITCICNYGSRKGEVRHNRI